MVSDEAWSGPLPEESLGVADRAGEVRLHRLWDGTLAVSRADTIAAIEVRHLDDGLVSMESGVLRLPVGLLYRPMAYDRDAKAFICKRVF